MSLQKHCRSSGWLIGLLSCLPITAAHGQWEFIGPEGGSISAIAQHPVAANIFFAATQADYYSKFFTSVDYGQTWTETGSINAPATSIIVNPSDPSIIFACSNGTLSKSTDGGAVWSRVTFPSYHYPYAMCIDPSNTSVLHAAGYIYSVTRQESSPAYFKSTDGGTTWRAADVPALTMTNGYGYLLTIAIDHHSPQQVYVGGYTCDPNYTGRVFKSTDGGDSFSECSGTIVGAANHILCDPSIAGKVYLVTAYGIYRSSNSGVSWSNAVYIPSPLRIAMSPLEASYVYAITSQNGCYRSTDGGVTWSSRSSGLSSMRTTDLLVEWGNGASVFVTTGTGISHSSNRGDSWTLSNAGLYGASVSALALAPSQRSRLYAGVEPDGVFKTSNVLNGGIVDWEPSGSFYSCRNTVPSVLVSPTNPDSVFVLEGGG